MLTEQQTADLDHRSTIELVSVPYLVKEPELLNACLIRAQRHLNKTGTKITLYGTERDKSGWLEFSMSIEYPDGGRLFLGCIQRTVGAEPEFHS